MRPGEAMGLTWPCVELDSDPGVLHVRHYLRRGAEGVFLGAPKTAQSSRSMDMPAFVSDALRAHLEGSETRAEGPWRDLVFPTGGGGYSTRSPQFEKGSERPLRASQITRSDLVRPAAHSGEFASGCGGASGVRGGPVGAFQCGDDSSSLCASGASDGAARRRAGGCAQVGVSPPGGAGVTSGALGLDTRRRQTEYLFPLPRW